MLVAYGSDLHLEFSVHKGFDYKYWDRHADVLILAGDILSVDWYKKAINQNSGHYSIAQSIVEYFKHINKMYDRVFYVMGNHEHYYGEFTKTYGNIQEFLDYYNLDNIILLEDDGYEYKGAVFYGATMWTDTTCNPFLEWDMRQGMSDYKLIKINDKGNYRKLHPRDTTTKHVESLKKLKEYSLSKDIDNFVLIMHHLPSYESIPTIYKTSKFNDAYYSKITEKVIIDNELERNPDYCVHGHTHSKTEYDFNGVRVVCNPRGYEGYESKVDCYRYEVFSI